MLSANHFILTASSKLTGIDIPIFRYLDFKVDDAYLKEEHIEYPISVTFDSNEIRFVYHQNVISDDGTPTCYNVELFHLKLDNHAEDQLEATIYKVFSKSIDCKPFEINQKYSKDNKRTASLHFSGLKMFSKEAIKDAIANCSKLFYRDLLLDFLFDVYHGEVFEQNPELDALKTSIEHSHIIKAIVAKAEFYYYSDVLLRTDKKNQDIVTFYQNQFLQSKSNWCKIIRDKESVEIFSLNKQWFHSTLKDGLEMEMRKVNETSKKIRKFLLTKNEPKQSTNDYYIDLDQQVETANYKWYLRRYNLIGAAGTIFKKPLLHLTIILSIAVVLITSFSFFLNQRAYIISINDHADLISFVANFISVFVVVSVGYFSFSNFNNANNNSGILNLLIPRVLLSMIPTLFFGIFALDIYSVFWNISIWESFSLLILSILVTLIFLNNEARSMAPDVKSRILSRSIIVIILTISFSITVNYFAHARYLVKVHNYSDIVIEYTKEVTDDISGYPLLSVTDRKELADILSSPAVSKKKELLTEKLILFRDQNKIEFALYELKASNCSIPWKWMGSDKEQLLFVPGFFIFSCVLSILFSVVIQLILDERAVTEPL